MEKNIAIRKNDRSMVSRIFSIPEVGIFIPMVLLIIIFQLLNQGFLSSANVFSMLKTMAFYGIVAIGETLIIIGGDFDVSVGSTAGFAAVFSTFLMMKFNCFGLLGTQMEWVGVIGFMAITIVVCSLVGFFNALLIVDVKLPPFITTIATLYAVRGAVMVVTNGNPIYPLPTFFMDVIGKAQIAVTSTNGEPVGFSLTFLMFITILIVFELLLRRTKFGRNIYSTGSNREVAKLAGINTRKVRYMNFIITAMLAALSGMMVAAVTRQGYPPIGKGWEMQIIAMTAIGGISLTGGSGSLIGTLIGVMIMNIMDTGLVMVGIDTFLQNVIQGFVILLAVFIDIMRRNQKLRA